MSLSDTPPRPPVLSQTSATVSLGNEALRAIEGERKTVTALFADLKGSTELMRELDPQDARAIVDTVLS
jgi:class 3 adenylate cyclase